jgi:hypothetical protein
MTDVRDYLRLLLELLHYRRADAIRALTHNPKATRSQKEKI